MTVREKAELLRTLSESTKHLYAYGLAAGEVMVQANGHDGRSVVVYIPSDSTSAVSAGRGRKKNHLPAKMVDLLDFASPAAWRASASLLGAVRNGLVKVKMER